MIDWAALEARKGQPSAADIAKAVQVASKLPAAGDKGHVQAMFPIYGKGLPAIDPDRWTTDAKSKVVKLKKLQATNAQLSRDNLVWHLKNPGKARMRSPRNTYPQVLKTKDGDLVIVDGHHRLSALRMLGVKKAQVWMLKETAL